MDPCRDWMLRADRLDAENSALREENMLLCEMLEDLFEACVCPSLSTARMREIRALLDGKHTQSQKGAGYADE